MKSKFIATLLLLTTTAHAQDMFLQTRIEERTLSALIDKTRVLLTNSNIGDHLTGVADFKDDTNFNLSDLVQDADYLKFSALFSSVFKVDLKDAVLRVRIPKIGYQVESLHAKPISMNVVDPVLDLGVTASIKGLTISLTAGLDLDLMIPNADKTITASYLTAHVDPTTITIPNTIEPISFNLDFETKRDQNFSYTLKSFDLSSMPDYVNRHLTDILVTDSAKNPISTQNITVNPVVVRLNSLTRTVSLDTFKPLLQKRLNKIISLVFTSIGKSLQTKIGPNLLKTVFSAKTPGDLVVSNNNLYTRFVTANFSQPASDQLYLGLIGELCTAESYKLNHEQCAVQEKAPEPVRVISEGDRLTAKSEVTESIARGTSDLVLSMSEEYLNRLLAITIKADLWKDSLSKQNLTLGPKGAFLVLDKRTQTPELFLDVLYAGDGTGIQNLLVNEKHPLHFPLRISTSLDFVNKDGIPHMVLKTEKLMSDANEIINGIPEYDLHSHLIRGFKRKIAHMVLEMSAQVEGQTAVDLDIPVLKNIDLEKTWHEASPFGRLNLFFKL